MKLKKQVINWRTLAVVLAIFLITIVFSGKDPGNKVSVIDGDFIARIYIEGIIYDDYERLENLKLLEEAKHARAVVVHINSPGGTPVGGENLYNSLLRISEKKPVVVVMGDVAASAAYMTAIAGDYLIAHQTTLTGSIGVIAQSFEFTELAKTIGVKFHNFKSSPLKGGPIPTEELTPEMKASIDETISDVYHTFMYMVATQRKLPIERLSVIADGRTFTGNQALKNGLVDAIGDEGTALDWLRKVKKVDPSIKIRDYSLIKEPSKLDMLFETINKPGNLFEKMVSTNSLFFL